MLETEADAEDKHLRPKSMPRPNLKMPNRTLLYCLVKEIYTCEQLAQGRHEDEVMQRPQPGVEPATSRSLVGRPYHYIIRHT